MRLLRPVWPQFFAIATGLVAASCTGTGPPHAPAYPVVWQADGRVANLLIQGRAKAINLPDVTEVWFTFDRTSGYFYTDQSPSLTMVVRSRREIAEIRGAFAHSSRAKPQYHESPEGLGEPSENIEFEMKSGRAVDFGVIEGDLPADSGPQVSKMFWKYWKRRFPHLDTSKNKFF